MSVSIALGLAAALLAASVSDQAATPRGEGLRTVDDISVAERRTPCAPAERQVRRDVVKALSALQASFTPNTMVHRPPYDPDAVLKHALRQAVFSHPQRYRAYCEVLRDVAERSVGSEAAFATLTLAARLERRRSGCIAPALKALPDTAETREALASFRETCAVDPALRCHAGG